MPTTYMEGLGFVDVFLHNIVYKISLHLQHEYYDLIILNVSILSGNI